MKKILFIHNTAAEYRLPFFIGLSEVESTDVKFIFTRMKLAEEIYGVKINYSELEKVKYVSLKCKFGVCLDLISVLLKEDFDGIFIPSMDSLGEYVDSIVSFIIAKIKRKKILYFTEKWEVKEKATFSKKIKNNIRSLLTKPFIKRCDSIVCSGTKAKEYMTKKIKVNDEKCLIAFDASETDKYTDNLVNIRIENNIGNKKIILYYGRIVERKGLNILIEAYDYLKKEFEDIYLLICGDGEFREACEVQVIEKNIKDVSFVGAVAPKNRNIYFSNSDIFVLPSLNYFGTIEAWGLTVNEAMQNKTAVIATDAVGAAYDMVLDNYNGFMVKEGDVEEMIKAIRKCIEDSNKLENMKINAFKTVKNNFNYKSMVEQFEDIIIKTI